MAKQQIMLSFPGELLSEPIIFNLSQEFNLITNIRRADITDERGWMLIELEGKAEDIEAGITWAISRGVRIDKISDNK